MPATASDRVASSELGAVPRIEVHVARTIADLECIRDVWSLWNYSRDTDFDYCLQFVWSSPEFVRPHVIVVYSAGIPDAIYVGRLDRKRFDTRIGYLRLPGIRTRLLTFTSDGFLGNASQENCEAVVRSIMTSLGSGEADAALLQQLAVDSALFRNAIAIPGFVSRDYVRKPTAHHILQLPESPEAFYRDLSGKHRKHLRSEAKKLLADFGGKVVIRCVRREPELDAVFSELEDVARRSYQRALGVGFRDTTESRRSLRLWARKGWLVIYLLYVKGRPSAFSIGCVCGGVYFCDYLGYEPQLAAYSPGNFLLTKMIEDFCVSGVRRVDFGLGDALYKERFGNLTRHESSIYIFATSLRGAVLNSIRAVTYSIDNTVKAGLDRTKLLPRIKKLWRSRLAGRDRGGVA